MNLKIRSTSYVEMITVFLRRRKSVQSFISLLFENEKSSKKRKRNGLSDLILNHTLEVRV